MVLRISHVKISRRIERDTPGIAELPGFSAGPANDLNRAIICIKYLNPAVSKFADILASAIVDANIIRIAQFASTGARFSIGAKELALSREDLNAMVTGIGDIKSVLRIDAQSFRSIEITGAIAGLPERIQNLCRGGTIRIWGQAETLDPLHWTIFADKNLFVGIYRNRSGERELTDIGAFLAPLRDEFALRCEMIHALIMRFNYYDVSVSITAHAFGFSKICLWHLPGKQEDAVGRELLHPTGHIDHKEIILRIH